MLKVQRGRKVGELKKWRDQDWVRIGTDGEIKGKCGTSKIKRILTGVFQGLKRIVFRKAKEPLPQEKRKREGKG